MTNNVSWIIFLIGLLFLLGWLCLVLVSLSISRKPITDRSLGERILVINGCNGIGLPSRVSLYSDYLIAQMPETKKIAISDIRNLHYERTRLWRPGSGYLTFFYKEAIRNTDSQFWFASMRIHELGEKLREIKKPGSFNSID